ncbi:MAG: hypothetical protein HY876_07555 [Coriobacteriales bacterium]|nr:hypothetical protein [Coriobacteriales bacterium]
MSEHRSGRAANGVDVLVVVLLALLVWPFPVARRVLTPPVHVAVVVAWVFLVAAAYSFIALVRWRRTLGMYLFDLRLPKSTSVAAMARWAAGWVLVAVPAVAFGGLVDPNSGLPARLAGTAAETVPKDSSPRAS